MMRCPQQGAFSATHRNYQCWCVLKHMGTLGNTIVIIC